LFDKRFEFTYRFPRLSEIHAPLLMAEAEIDQPDALRTEAQRLTDVKNKLDHKDLGLWHRHTNFTNPAGAVVWSLRDMGIEMPTQAWAKMMEILSAFPACLSVASGGADADTLAPIHSLHMCEAPGAFICATNHYIRQRWNTTREWDWLALTLNPHYEVRGH